MACRLHDAHTELNCSSWNSSGSLSVWLSQLLWWHISETQGVNVGAICPNTPLPDTEFKVLSHHWWLKSAAEEKGGVRGDGIQVPGSGAMPTQHLWQPRCHAVTPLPKVGHPVPENPCGPNLICKAKLQSPGLTQANSMYEKRFPLQEEMEGLGCKDYLIIKSLQHTVERTGF